MSDFSSSYGTLSDESSNLGSLPYRSLQIIAQEYALPGTLKKPVMVAMLQAKRAGDDELVEKIVNENRRYRTPKPSASEKAEKKASTVPKRKGPGRPPRERSPADVPEKRAKGGNSLAVRDQRLFKDNKREKMSSAQLHPTQPLLRALLDTTPSLECTARSVLHTAVTKLQHTNNGSASLAFFNRAQTLQQNLHSVAMFRNNYADQNPYNRYTYPPNAHIGNRCHPVGAQHGNVPRQPYITNFNAAVFNDNQAVYHNGQIMQSNGASAETIIPDMITYDSQSNYTQMRGQYELSSQYVHGSFGGGGELCGNIAGGNFGGHDAWNRSNRWHAANAHERSAARRLFPTPQRQVFQARPGFKDTGGCIISNAYEISRTNNNINGNMNIRNSNQVYDLSVPKPNLSQDLARLLPSVDGIFQGGSVNYYENNQQPFVGSSQDVAFTQTNNNAYMQQWPHVQNGQHGQFVQEGAQNIEINGQTYTSLVNVRRPPPAYQSPQSLRRSQQAALEMPASQDKAYGSCSGSEATESSPEDPDLYEVEASGRPVNDQANGTGNVDANAWPPNQTAENSHYPEFRDRNPLCLPVLYDYLEASGEMDQFHNMDAAADCVVELAPSAVSTPTKTKGDTQSLELTPQHQQQEQQQQQQLISSPSSPIVHTAGRNQVGDSGLHRCKFAANGCEQMYPAQQLQFHEQGCLHLMIRCPMDLCPWGGRLGRLADHICDVGGHKHEVVCGEKQTFSFDLTKLCENSCLHFAQQCYERLFVVTIVYRGFQVHVFLQEIATYAAEEAKSPTAKGYLEIVGKDGYPYSWNGLVAPIQVSLVNMVRSGQCLTIHIGDIATNSENCISLYDMITL